MNHQGSCLCGFKNSVQGYLPALSPKNIYVKITMFDTNSPVRPFTEKDGDVFSKGSLSKSTP